MRKRWNSLSEALRRLIAALRQGRTTLVAVGVGDEVDEDNLRWDECFSLLEGILVPADEFAWLRLRLQNGHGYFLAGESGAACYEVGMVLRRVRSLQRLYA
ncbi:MAG: hypothetical protein K2V38_07480 [Gemmataceae bacterium]|nr:hypothetical protein [Gemmataceae bacterium]